MNTVMAEPDTLDDIAATLPLVMPSLDRGNLLPWLRLHELAGVKPPTDAIVRFANSYLEAGRLDEALYAYNLAGVLPDAERLLRYERKFSDRRPEETERARYLAQSMRRDTSLATRIRRWYQDVARRPL